MEFINPHELSNLPKNSRILVGFSGGADSCALLRLICEYAEKSGSEIFAAHVHHGIRGGEADRDLNFCRAAAEAYGVTFFSERFDVPKIAKASGESLEGAGRRIRYSYFSELMRNHGIKILALAHHADDNLETVIYNLVRGSGAKGMCGIPPARRLDGVDGGVLIRPLINATKSEILAYCKENRLDFVTDSTNLQDDCSRNLIRNKIIPLLSEIRPEPQKSCSRMTEALTEDCSALDSAAESEFYGCGDGIPLERLNAQPPAIAKRMISLLTGQYGISHSSYMINCVFDACRIGNSAEITLSDGFNAKISGGMLKVFKNSLPSRQEYNIFLNPGVNTLPGGVAVSIHGEIPEGYVKITSARVVASGRISAHSRLPDDKINTMGMTKSLKKLFNERQVPTELRAFIPIICDSLGTLLVPDCAVRTDALNSDGIEISVLFSNELYKNHKFISEKNHHADE